MRQRIHDLMFYVSETKCYSKTYDYESQLEQDETKRALILYQKGDRTAKVVPQPDM
jgi:hypothetical protein